MTVYMFPGQGSQKVGMGEGLFEAFPDLTKKADEILGFSIAQLCLTDPNKQLGQTQFTQPALYVVNALSFQKKMQEGGKKPDYLIGHSLGEYVALYAGECFDFATGLKLVKKRGELMAGAQGGGMAAIVGIDGFQAKDILTANHLDTIDIANYNSITQIVISGKKADIDNAQQAFEKAGAKMYIPLNVSGAFHSRYMTEAHDAFKQFLEQFTFAVPKIPVLSNFTAEPYTESSLKNNLAEQINHSVKWTDMVQYLIKKNETEFEEIGPGKVLTGLVTRIQRGQ